ncbi:MAG: cyclase family protein [Firmicutes bacterium]|nr:cyclase family protein [Bacillota bacterium]
MSSDFIHTLSNILSNLEFVDLSHRLEEDIPTFPTHSHFYHLKWENPDDPATMFQFMMHEHNGTHVDAPAHYLREGVGNREDAWIDAIPLQTLIGPCKVLQLAGFDNRNLLSKCHIEDWEANHVRIQKDDIVLLNFGWHKRWTTSKERYQFAKDWPGLTRDAALYLAEKEVKAVGTDCIGLDCCGSTEIPAHDVLLARNILIMENLANLDLLPDESFFIAFPLKIKQGSGSPIRAVSLIPKTGGSMT